MTHTSNSFIHSLDSSIEKIDKIQKRLKNTILWNWIISLVTLDRYCLSFSSTDLWRCMLLIFQSSYQVWPSFWTDFSLSPKWFSWAKYWSSHFRTMYPEWVTSFIRRFVFKVAGSRHSQELFSNFSSASRSSESSSEISATGNRSEAGLYRSLGIMEIRRVRSLAGWDWWYRLVWI